MRLTIHDVAHVGAAGVAIDVVVLLSLFAIAVRIGRLLEVGAKTTALFGTGSSVGGPPAVTAGAPVVRTRSDQAAIAVAAVAVFGAAAVLLYPTLTHVNGPMRVLRQSAPHMGVLSGSTIHQATQVIAIGDAVGGASRIQAVTAVLVQVMMLAPFLTALSLHSRLWSGPASIGRVAATAAPRSSRAGRPSIPWFAFGFVAVVLINSFAGLPVSLAAAASALDMALFATAMAALGLSTDMAALRRTGTRPMFISTILLAWLAFGGAAFSRGAPMLLAWLSS
jgi:uncharacterized integral membrane protein (TIGR00698 family)